MSKKIVYLINSLSSGGAERVVTVLLEELQKRKMSVELVCLENCSFYSVPPDIPVTFLSNRSGDESGFLKLLLLPLLALKLKKYCKKRDISLVQSHLYRANYVNILSSLFGARHEVQIVNHGIMSRYDREGVLGKVNLFLIKFLYGFADLIILNSRGVYDDMYSLHKFSNPSVVINNPFSIAEIQKLSVDFVDDFEFLADKKYLVSVGRLIPLKRVDDLIRVVAGLADNVVLLIFGEGPEEKMLRGLSVELGVEGRIHFMGWVKNPFKYVSRCDLFVSASESESFSNVIVEALACGTSVVSSDCISGPREILAPEASTARYCADAVENAEYGVLFPVGNIDALQAGVTTVLNDDELRGEYERKGTKRAESFDVEVIADKYMNIMTSKMSSHALKVFENK